MATRALAVCLVAAWAALSNGAAHAGVVATLAVDDPTGCIDDASLDVDVRGHVQRAWVATSAAVRVVVTVRRDGAVRVATVDVSGSDRPEARRVIRGQRCVDVRGSVALAIAVALDPWVALGEPPVPAADLRPVARPRPPEASAPTRTRRRPEPAPEAAIRIASIEPTASWWLHGGTRLNAIAALTPISRLEIGLVVRYAAVEAMLEVVTPFTVHTSNEPLGRLESVELTGTLGVCGALGLWRLCGAADVGGLMVREDTSTAPWKFAPSIGVGPRVGFVFPLTSRLALRAAVGVPIGVVRPELRSAGQTVWSAPLVGVTLRVGVAVRL